MLRILVTPLICLCLAYLARSQRQTCELVFSQPLTTINRQGYYSLHVVNRFRQFIDYFTHHLVIAIQRKMTKIQYLESFPVSGRSNQHAGRIPKPPLVWHTQFKDRFHMQSALNASRES